MDAGLNELLNAGGTRGLEIAEEVRDIPILRAQDGIDYMLDLLSLTEDEGGVDQEALLLEAGAVISAIGMLPLSGQRRFWMWTVRRLERKGVDWSGLPFVSDYLSSAKEEMQSDAVISSVLLKLERRIVRRGEEAGIVFELN